MDKHILIGNGIDVQFGGYDNCSNGAIMKRVRENILSGKYQYLIDDKISAETLLGIFKSYVEIVDQIRAGKHDKHFDGLFMYYEIVRIKNTYPEHSTLESVGLEDYFLAAEIENIWHKGTEKELIFVFRTMLQIMVDAIYNEGKVNLIQFPKKVIDFLNCYDEIFSVNYDESLDNALNNKNVIHLHGDFKTLGREYDRNSAYYKKHPSECEELIRHYDKNAPQLYSNAVMSWYWMDKFAELNEDNNDQYGFEKLKNISGQLVIIGLAPRNDEHLFITINQNSKIKSVVFYYYNESECEEIKKHITKPITCMPVKELWEELK